MKIIQSEYITFWDVDETLIFPISRDMPGKPMDVYDAVENKKVSVTTNESMIRLMKEEKHKGSTIVVWSRGGWQWASNVVKALGLEDIVTLVMSKPMAYMDDLDISEWLKYRVYIPPTVSYKK